MWRNHPCHPRQRKRHRQRLKKACPTKRIFPFSAEGQRLTYQFSGAVPQAYIDSLDTPNPEARRIHAKCSPNEEGEEDGEWPITLPTTRISTDCQAYDKSQL